MKPDYCNAPLISGRLPSRGLPLEPFPLREEAVLPIEDEPRAEAACDFDESDEGPEGAD